MDFFPKRGDVSPERGPNHGGKLNFDPQYLNIHDQAYFQWKRCLEQQKSEVFVKLKPFLCREAIEEANFGGHFRELHSTFFSSISCVGLLRSRITQPN
jgi:hypothetical protein